MNLKDLRNEVMKDNDDSLNNADVTSWINRGLDDLSIVAKYTRTTTYTLVNGQSEYALPSDFLEVAALNPDFPRLPLNDFESEGYKVIGNTIKIQPTPKSGSLEMIYYATLPRLVGDTDIPAIPAPFHDLLVLFTVAKAKFVDEIDDMQAIALNEYYSRKEDFARYVNRSRSVQVPIKNVYSRWF